VVLDVDLDLLFGTEDFDCRGDLKSSDLKVRVKELIHDLLVGVILEDSGNLANLIDLQGRQFNFVLLNKQVRSQCLSTILNLNLISSNVACNDLARNCAFLLLTLPVVFQLLCPVCDESLYCLFGQDLEQWLVVLKRDVLLLRLDQYLLWQVALVFKRYLDSRA
jgi:hypothetical protein